MRGRAGVWAARLRWLYVAAIMFDGKILNESRKQSSVPNASHVISRLAAPTKRASGRTHIPNHEMIH
jgi:hypothetical protein